MKTYLNRAYKIEHRINVKLERLEGLRALAEKTTATLSDMPKSPNRDSGNEDILARIIDMENEIKRDINNLLDIKEDVQDVIETVEEPELKLLLELRYLCYRSWGDIAEEMNYDEKYLHKLHSRALILLKERKEDTKRH
mgnify:CR=1 FL=1